MQYSATDSCGSNTPPWTPSSSGATSNPMQFLTRVFQTHPTALCLHRQLTIALANGDAEGAADLASILAQTIRRVHHDEKPNLSPVPSMESGRQAGTSFEQAEALPPPSPDDLNEAMGAAEGELKRQFLLHDLQQSQRHPTGLDPNIRSSSRPRQLFWRSPNSLCITTIESIYEAAAPKDGEDSPLTTAGDRTIVKEGQEMAILDQYLTKNASQLAAQKEALTKTVLEVAQALGLTPEDLHAAEGASLDDRLTQTYSPRQAHDTSSLNALRHCNLVIRAEAPDMEIEKDNSEFYAKVSEEVSILKKRICESGAPFSDIEEKMATYELMMVHTTMRYVVGIHRDMQVALDHSAEVEKCMQKSGADTKKGSSFFIQKVMQALHIAPDQFTNLEGDVTGAAQPSVEQFERTKVIQRPVIPYTYMLKCCLWFNIPSETEI
ncbi:unnamed protein product [Phytomonas sp. Hart1]|nr:unnamed protein product [Phytomonas sp. Hart1]|eukprot:CCW67009.1 unnamed protein product [Phytomonas sp. isolate Hart1]